MTIKRPSVRKKNTRKEVILPSETIKVLKNADVGRMKEVQALFYFMCSIMISISLFSFEITDIGINSKGEGVEIHNALGMAGAYLSAFLIDYFGVAAWMIPCILFGIGYQKLSGSVTFSVFKSFGIFLSPIVVSIIIAGMGFSLAEEKSGGFIGHTLYLFMSVWLGTVGVYVIVLMCIPILVKIVFDISLIHHTISIAGKVFESFTNKTEEAEEHSTAKMPDIQTINTFEVTRDSSKNTATATAPVKQKQKIKRFTSLFSFFKKYLPKQNTETKQDAIFDDLMSFDEYDPSPNSVKIISKENVIEKTNNRTMELLTEVDDLPYLIPNVPLETKEEKKEILEPIAVQEVEKDIDEIEDLIELPNAGLLGKAPNITLTVEEKRKIEEVGTRIIACLDEFKVKADLIGYTPGPVVTQYEIRPHAGVRVSKIKTLGDDIALKLEAISVRIQAPIPETDLIGIEVPNKKRQAVYFQELINSEAFKNQKSLLTLALGKDTAGVPFFSDLGQMPHLLIAGATGAGKSVCLNSIILSLLYKATPKEVQLLLIDPKRVELKSYEDLPHLVHPVVTDMEIARTALQWAVDEMERRYSKMEQMGSKDITDFNKRVRTILAGNNGHGLEELPYLVILIDELADLILTATKEVETNLTRLSQLARASGIHLILATQRPSVDVVTALIKANFPSRIAFRVTSRHDSGTILDTVGAEKLLGKGDMLFKTTQTQRLHGAYVSTEEVEAVVEYWKSKEKPNYLIDLVQWQKEKAVSSSTTGLFADENDPQYQEAINFVCERGEASISSIQRRFRIGFNKAARYVEQMEQSGILENVGGSKRRVTRQQIYKE